MSGGTALVVAPEAAIYDHGSQHPLRPLRVLLTWDLIAAYGLDRAPGVARLGAEPAGDETLLLVHTRDFLDATKAAGRGDDGPWGRFGYGPGDNPIFDRMHEAGAIVAGASVAAARAVVGGEVAHAFNAAGGLHHAMPDRASGFCVYDDPAIAIAWMLAAGRRARRLRRRRRAPRRRAAGDLLERPEGAHGVDPRVRARARVLPGHGRPVGARRPRRAGLGRERAAARRARATTGGSRRSARWCRPSCARSRPTCS